MRSKVKLISLTALFAALILVATAYAKVPLVLGYVHLGDVFIVIACFMLPPPVAVCVAAIGSMLADLLAGFVLYMPITFLAKGLMALIFSLFYYKKFKLWRVPVGVIVGSVVMVGLYFVFEMIYYGFPAALANLPMQFIQPAVSLPVGSLISFVLSKISYINSLKSEISIKKGQKSKDDGDENDPKSAKREP